jgi:prepilin-type N-terminal cleavage/methylation domain-containing protein/prepilin-type processing-associated H-X9-DG protein
MQLTRTTLSHTEPRAKSQEPRARAKRAFTLIELLVVIAIIAILAAILFPVFAQARSKARQTGCLSNQKQIALAWQMYAQDYDETSPNPQFIGRIWAYTKCGTKLTFSTPLQSKVIRRCDDIYFQDLIRPYAKNEDFAYCPSTGKSYVWQGVFKQQFIENRTSYWYNWFYWDGEPLAKVNKIADSPITIDMPYGPTYAHLPHNNGINVAYADGHAKWVRVTDHDLPATSGNWYDQWHQADGQ